MSQPLIDLQHISKSFDGELILDLRSEFPSGKTASSPYLVPAAGKDTTHIYCVWRLTSPDTEGFFLH